MAHLLEESGRCQSCGTTQSEWDEDLGAYEAVAIMCRGCLVKDAAQEDAPDIPGTRVTLVPRAVAERMRNAPKKAPVRR